MASVFSLLVLLVSTIPFFATAQTNGRVDVGASLTAGAEVSSWLSPSGEFAFGFHQLEETDMFLLSIWYDKIPDKTVVWCTEGGNPVARGSKVALTANSGLVLDDSRGNWVWNSSFTGFEVSYAVMNDTGNFVLQSSDSDSLWESFSNPTDTLLPSQTMETGGMLLSRQTETNFSQGRFQLRFDSGNLVLNAINLPTNFPYNAYYSSNTRDFSNSSNDGYQLRFNESGYLYVLRRSGQRFLLTTQNAVSTSSFYHRATLNFDGVLTQYYYPKSSSIANRTWSPVWSQPDNICVDITADLGSGACGFNSICSVDGNKRPVCSCPQTYSLLDLNDKYGNCIPDAEIRCQTNGLNSTEDSYDFVERSNVDWPLSDYEQFRPYNEADCKSSCQNDCLCAVAIFRDNSCWKKKLPLSNGREDVNLNSKAFIKFRKGYVPPERPLPGAKEEQGNLIVTGAVLLGCSVFVNFALVCAFCLSFFFVYRKKLVKLQRGKTGVESNLRNFTYKELADATDNFKNELGRGAFGAVYKGVIGAGSTCVAVKKLNKVVQEGEKEFETEVHVIGLTHHKNLVRLLGFCDEGQHRLLVYEFLSHGTLASFLFGKSKPSWFQRTQMALGIARGLLYLHEECKSQIIHCDIKPQNILLDDYYNARISDFGLAKLLMMDQTRTHTIIRGTKGYVAPDWFRSATITVKVDVYSYGVTLLEIISCRRCVDLEVSGEEKAILTDWAYDCYTNGTLNDFIGYDMEAINDMWKVERMVKIAIWCIQEDPSRRPSMRSVTQMLEGVVDVPVPPNPSPFNASF